MPTKPDFNPGWPKGVPYTEDDKATHHINTVFVNAAEVQTGAGEQGDPVDPLLGTHYSGPLLADGTEVAPGVDGNPGTHTKKSWKVRQPDGTDAEIGGAAPPTGPPTGPP